MSINPFFPATVFPTATIAWAQVDDIDLLAPPPTVRVGGELLMVSAVDRDKLAEYAGRHPIDWTWLLRAPLRHAAGSVLRP